MATTTTHRVPEHTSSRVNEDIRSGAEARIAVYAQRSPEEIDRRLKELDFEWDIERILQANAATISVLAVGLGLTKNRVWFLLPGVVGAFLLQHAVQGWCPPVELFRRLGVRTASEINEERVALKALRGDFKNLPTALETDDIHRIVDAVRR